MNSDWPLFGNLLGKVEYLIASDMSEHVLGNSLPVLPGAVVLDSLASAQTPTTSLCLRARLCCPGLNLNYRRISNV